MADDFWTYDKPPSQQTEWVLNGGDGERTDLGWGSFDYDNPSVPTVAPPAQPNYYDQLQHNYSSNNYYNGSMFLPNAEQCSADDPDDFANEPPLLDELGFNFSHIQEKTLAVLNPRGTASVEVIEDQDLTGPLVFCFLFGGALLLHGKISFGDIYAIGGIGCVGLYALMNLMAVPPREISFTCTSSILGYCLLPMALLSLLTAFLPFKGLLVYGISLLAVLWCTLSSSKLFVTALSMQPRRVLVAYPCFLLYSLFALLALF